MKKISPSILACDFLNLEQDIKKLEQSDCEMLHLDVMDGHFVNNLTFGYQLIKALRSISTKFFDAHLMISNPSQYIKEYVDAGCDCITIHCEIQEDLQAIINKIKSYNKQVGIALNPQSPISKIKPYLQDIDLVLVMSVNPGFGGQSFIKTTQAKIDELALLRNKNHYHYQISVDGGVNDQILEYVTNADILVSGSFILKGDINKNISRLR